MKITPSVERHFEVFACRFGAAYTDEMFQTGAKALGLVKAIAAVGMCSMLAMTEILEYVPVLREELLEGQISTILRRWGKNRAKVTENVRVNGELKQHTFDFVLTSHNKAPVAVSILSPTAGALSAAERFGFKTKDLAGTQFSTWRTIAIEAKAEVWSAEARRIVDRCADAVIPVRSGDPASDDELRGALDRMVA